MIDSESGRTDGVHILALIPVSGRGESLKPYSLRFRNAGDEQAAKTDDFASISLLMYSAQNASETTNSRWCHLMHDRTLSPLVQDDGRNNQ